jgi:curved DNA-binding protein CbpA
VTRESIPRFDLYGELEVSRLASVAAIEAAYRALVKRHHPDVAPADGDARIKRLNLAREWLRDPERRRRYDEARGPRLPDGSASIATQHRPRTSRATATGLGAAAAPTGDGRTSTSTTFGVHSAAVRQFLSDLRAIDRPRAQQIWDGRAVAHAKGYTAARRRALAASRAGHHGEWQFAREAASVIARGKLGESTLTSQVVDVIADIAGAITIHDLISRADFEVLMLPWTWRGKPAAGGVAASVVPVARPRATEPKARPAKPPPAGLPPTEAAPKVGSAPTPAPVTPPPAAAPQTEPVPKTEPEPTPAPAATSASVAPRDAVLAATSAPRDAVLAAGSARPVPRASISDLGVSPWQLDKAEEAAATEPPPPSGIARILPSGLAGKPAPVRSWAPVAAVVVAVVALGALLSAINSRSQELAVSGVTDAPTATAVSVGAASALPSTNDPIASPSDPLGASAAPSVPGVTAPTSGPNASSRPGATTTPRSTPRPSPGPSPSLPPGPTPTPPPPLATPTPTPPACIVPNLFDVNTTIAPLTWSSAGFTGPMTFSPSVPPHYRIKWQSLGAGLSVDCTSGITVQDATP